MIDTISLFHLEEWLKNNSPVDLIISTMPIRRKTGKVVVVSPFLSGEDIGLLEEQLHLLPKKDRTSYADRSNIEEAVGKVDGYGKALAGLINNIVIADHFTAGSKMELIPKTVGFIAEHFEVKDADLLRRDLEKREELGPVMLEDDHIAMLHCRSEGVGEMWIAVFRLESEVIWSSNGQHAPVRTVLTMMGPPGAPKENFELISETSVSLIEEEVIEMLKHGSAEAIKEGIQFILKKGYIRMAGDILR